MMKQVIGVEGFAILLIVINSRLYYCQGKNNVSDPFPKLFTVPSARGKVPLIYVPSDDIIIPYENKNTSFLGLATQLNARFTKEFLNGCEVNSHRSCVKRCGKPERDKLLRCYCDDICRELGDCCYDYYSRCKKSFARKTSRYSCYTNELPSDWGFILISNCPAFINQSSQLARACVHPDLSDIFQQVPVFDRETSKSYRNYFCAKCNQVLNFTFWAARDGCMNIEVQQNRQFNLTLFMKRYCTRSWNFSPPKNAIPERCLRQKYPGWCGIANSNQNIDWEMVQNLCEAYYLPMCKPHDERYRNPHCLLCGKNTTSPLIDWQCRGCIERAGVRPPPGMQILFDFSSSSQYKVNVGNQKTVIIKIESCNQRQVYDPFSQSCRDVPHFQYSFVTYKTNISSNNSNSNFTSNCVGAVYENNEVQFLPNGSVYIPRHKRVYPKSLYIANGSIIILCTNFSGNNTRNVTVILGINSENKHSLAFRIITYIGSAVSVVSLIILIALYVRINETRKLPGKITMGLSCTLLIFQVIFAFTGFTGIPALCSAIAVVLHYLLLSVFTWMNVLAANMAYTFVTMEYRAAAAPLLNSEKKKFLKYACHGCISPLVWVTVCVALEWSHTVNIGYGSRTSCWISNRQALLFAVCLPVALILCFNITALVVCVFTIRRTRKNTRQVSKDSKPLDLPLLSLKLSVIFGLTWVLGSVAPFEATAFVWYPFVILSSLQGFLLFLALKAHTKVYNLLKGYVHEKSSSAPQVNTKSTKDFIALRSLGENTPESDMQK